MEVLESFVIINARVFRKGEVVMLHDLDLMDIGTMKEVRAASAVDVQDAARVDGSPEEGGEREERTSIGDI
jgi:hypothetical protein